MLCCGGAVTIGAIAGSQPDTSSTTPAANAAGLSSESREASESAAPTAIAGAAVPSPSVEATPTIEKRTVAEQQAVPFATKTVKDASLPKGTRKVRTPGVAGVKTATYEVTFTNGVQTGKKLVRQQVTKAPVTQVIAVGTKATSRCDPNYSGACVPIASDVDCAGGSGNGPAYVQGPVKVIGDDIYDLDRNSDGIACED
ncbi:G5 domain-containing protein [Micromonospora sp. NPDC049679]|uniref:G5 domain-containing protein n=1 Tax=Micromonospora sp. NPDC049679 TaxID=3155920 RepID=UPI0033D640D8